MLGLNREKRAEQRKIRSLNRFRALNASKTLTHQYFLKWAREANE
jgi:hypothetical protein